MEDGEVAITGPIQGCVPGEQIPGVGELTHHRCAERYSGEEGISGGIGTSPSWSKPSTSPASGRDRSCWPGWGSWDAETGPAHFWASASKALDGLRPSLGRDQRQAIEAKLASRVPKPGRRPGRTGDPAGGQSRAIVN
jgi:hypothetical protein